MVGVGGSGLTVGSGSGSVVGVGVGGIAGGMRGMGRTRVGSGNGRIAGVVKDIVRHIVAAFWHTHDVGL